ncbi:MAG: hypothetical protein G01um101448_519 [Parcubacteria group bacterium Gr01-1014_48]|nr:MAG: hypothetical protein Greene041614_185 [Parcubacteria group bacterium Greene0416_14]TSC73830.1 MAG: hypothetical protein G01um101448_519 [Parcubacteria group bacterium Gr01-1014_48]TSD01211.1 MAG: hypothetical protein Greene101415_406 [Parcubacteria group bacterium Greene1014_15]TSD07313.1 MAG: hypothetical protein Greene07144_946 [Parcubacteria group bacterium Greene0714_4]
MRNIVNISLPDSLVKEVEQEVKNGGFASKSEFFRHVLREHRLAKELANDRKSFERGKGKVLKSLRDLRG